MNSQESGSFVDIQQRFKLSVIQNVLGMLTCTVVHVSPDLGIAKCPRRACKLCGGSGSFPSLPSLPCGEAFRGGTLHFGVIRSNKILLLTKQMSGLIWQRIFLQYRTCTMSS